MQRIQSKELTRPLALEILGLQNSVWSSQEHIDSQCDRFLQNNAIRPQCEMIVVRHGEVLLAGAEIFSRTIICENQTYDVGCLAGVCVSPQRQGEGLGKALVQKIFGLIDTREFQVFLFQTEVSQFYLKLGAQVIQNRFIDRQSPQPFDNPWWDNNIMIYPASYPWPSGVIDLNGGAF